MLVGSTSASVGSEVAGAFRPSAVTVRVDPPDTTDTVVRGRVRELETRNELVRVRIGDLFADVTPARVSDLDLEPGRDVYFIIDPGQVAIYPLERQPVT
jgi:molybdate transport system ATP-binding protein